jgi:hypothetical protein
VALTFFSPLPSAGSISDEIWRLPQLTTIDLGNNE